MMFVFWCGCATSQTIEIDSNWKILVSKSCDPLIDWAAHELASDMEQILGSKIEVVYGKEQISSKSIVIGQQSETLFNGSTHKDLEGKWEHFSLSSNHKQLQIQGSDVRGTVYGVFDFAEKIGISPWIWWADVKPAPSKQIKIAIPAHSKIQGPSVQYRGIFLNDEDWGLHPWAAKTFEPETGDIGPKTYEKIFQLLLRLKANTIWPAMHPCTKAFYKIPGNNEMAQKYHIVVGTSHCEPMLRNNVDEWDHHTKGAYNYFTNKKSICKYWNERITQVKDAENIVTLGMRGVHDGHMHGGNSLEEKVDMLEQIIDDQRNMLTDIKKKSLDSIATTVVLYKEVLDLYNNGLQIPEEATIMWCDDNHGYIRRLSNEEEQKRKGGSGVYYHLSYWGSPHDYLWLSSTQPGLIWYEMSRAYANGARKIWIANVGDIKPCEYNMEFFLDLAWDINSISAETIDEHMQNWAQREFGKSMAKEIVEIKKEYYRLASIRRPEFMGWTQTEPPTPISITEFNPNANGNELMSRIRNYRQIAKKVQRLTPRVSENKKDAWFQLIEYPVLCSKLMNEKLLYAQLARHEYDDAKREEWIAKSKNAYQSIHDLTEVYNNKLASGKWRHMMSGNPRGLPVFGMPDCKSEDIEKKKNKAASHSIIAIQGDEFTVSKGVDQYDWRAVEGLGYSDNSIVLMPLKNRKFSNEQPTVQYTFNASQKGEFELQIRFLPSHVNDRDQEVTVKIDNQEAHTFLISTKGRSVQWKQNTLRNHAIVKLVAEAKKKGTHTVTVSANQTGIVIDQLAVDFNRTQKYYTIPHN